MTATGTAARPPETQVTVYDFRQPMTLAREHSRVLEMALETFSRHWATRLVAHLRTSVQVKFEKLEMCTYTDYVGSLPQMTTLMVFGMEGGRRTGVLEFSLEHSMGWVDRLLGGVGVLGAVPLRDLTEIEQGLIRYLIEPTLQDLGYAFSTVIPLEANFKHFQYAPQMMQAVAASTPVLVAHFTVEVDSDVLSATLMLPAEDVIQALGESQSSDTRAPDEIEAEQRERLRLEGAVQQVPVDMVMRLRPQPIHPRDLLTLTEGDLLPLFHSVTQPMEIVVGDRVLAEAAVGSSGARLAAVITNVKENT